MNSKKIYAIIVSLLFVSCTSGAGLLLLPLATPVVLSPAPLVQEAWDELFSYIEYLPKEKQDNYILSLTKVRKIYLTDLTNLLAAVKERDMIINGAKEQAK